MAKCQFTTKYWNFESQAEVDYKCPDDEENLGLGLCIFHDENYLQDKNSREEHEQRVRDKLQAKVHTSIDQKEALLGIGYHLPDNITMKGDFIKLVFFSKANLQRIDFSSAKFSGGANFVAAKFSGRADFRSAKFSGEANFGEAKLSGEANFGEPLISEPNFRHQFNIG